MVEQGHQQANQPSRECADDASSLPEAAHSQYATVQFVLPFWLPLRGLI